MPILPVFALNVLIRSQNLFRVLQTHVTTFRYLIYLPEFRLTSHAGFEKIAKNEHVFEASRNRAGLKDKDQNRCRIHQILCDVGLRVFPISSTYVPVIHGHSKSN